MLVGQDHKFRLHILQRHREIPDRAGRFFLCGFLRRFGVPGAFLVVKRLFDQQVLLFQFRRRHSRQQEKQGKDQAKGSFHLVYTSG